MRSTWMGFGASPKSSSRLWRREESKEKRNYAAGGAGGSSPLAGVRGIPLRLQLKGCRDLPAGVWGVPKLLFPLPRCRRRREIGTCKGTEKLRLDHVEKNIEKMMKNTMTSLSISVWYVYSYGVHTQWSINQL